MSVAALAGNAARLWKSVPPGTVGRLTAKVSDATKGLVGSGGDVASYVGNDANRAQVIAANMAAVGVNPDALFDGIDVTKPLMKKAYERSVALYQSIADEVNSRGLKADGGDDAQMSAAVIASTNKRRVEIALQIFGSAERYFACQGLDAANFAAAKVTGTRRVSGY